MVQPLAIEKQAPLYSCLSYWWCRSIYGYARIREMAVHHPVAGSFTIYCHYMGPLARIFAGWNYVLKCLSFVFCRRNHIWFYNFGFPMSTNGYGVLGIVCLLVP